MEKSNLEELLSVLEEIRVSKFPKIPPEVVHELVSIQYENQAENDRTRGRTITTRVVSRFLEGLAEEERRNRNA